MFAVKPKETIILPRACLSSWLQSAEVELTMDAEAASRDRLMFTLNSTISNRFTIFTTKQ